MGYIMETSCKRIACVAWLAASIAFSFAICSYLSAKKLMITQPEVMPAARRRNGATRTSGCAQMSLNHACVCAGGSNQGHGSAVRRVVRITCCGDWLCTRCACRLCAKRELLLLDGCLWLAPRWCVALLLSCCACWGHGLTEPRDGALLWSMHGA